MMTGVDEGTGVAVDQGTGVAEAAPAEATPAVTTPADTTPADTTPADGAPADAANAEGGVADACMVETAKVLEMGATDAKTDEVRSVIWTKRWSSEALACNLACSSVVRGT